ncbi:MAG: hypothetical protein KJZ86_16105 [Caldilineaceae bacterium]|nr:hypothetical protein [Caldilineaceae bacterium]HRJ41193.1 hypothetical protein [Caldilineaceae bacterium]
MQRTEDQKQQIGQSDRSRLLESLRPMVVENVRRAFRQMEDEANEKAVELRLHYPQLSYNQARRLVHSREWPEEYIVTCLHNFATYRRSEDWQDLLTLLSVVKDRLNLSLLAELAARYRVQDVWQEAQKELT